jgi:hypothetical protein
MSKSRVCPKCLCMIHPWSFEWRGLCDYCVVPCKCPYVPGEHFAAKGNHCGYVIKSSVVTRVRWRVDRDTFAGITRCSGQGG